MNTNMTISGLNVDVEYRIYGQRRSATRFDPEEYPEIEILKVTTSEDIFDLVENQVPDIESAILEELNEDAA